MEIMEETLFFATIIAPIVMALAELLKQMNIVPVRFMPLFVVVLSVIVALLASPFTDLPLALRAWGGLFAGMSAVGLYEIVLKRRYIEKDKDPK